MKTYVVKTNIPQINKPRLSIEGAVAIIDEMIEAIEGDADPDIWSGEDKIMAKKTRGLVGYFRGCRGRLLRQQDPQVVLSYEPIKKLIERDVVEILRKAMTIGFMRPKRGMYEWQIINDRIEWVPQHIWDEVVEMW